MKINLGVAKCGLACCLCAENNVCTGCDTGECSGKEGLLSKIKPYGFTLFIKQYGVKKFLDCLEKNEKKGIYYRYPNSDQDVGDYDKFTNIEDLFNFLLTGT